MKKVKKLLNISEKKVFIDLKKSSMIQYFNIFPQQEMKLVIDLEDITLSKKEKKTFNNSVFDFVITDLEMNPIFIIEFDGPDHKREDNILSDLRKMSICKKANLSILRVDYIIYDKFSHSLIIDFLIYRYYQWNNEKEKLNEDFSVKIKYLESTGMSIQEIADYVSVEEPEMEFNYKYYYPEIQNLRKILYEKFNLYPGFLELSSEDPFMSKYTSLNSSFPNFNDGLVTSKTEYILNCNLKNGNAISSYKTIIKSEPIEMIWQYNYYNLIKESTKNSGIDNSESFENGIPGTRIYDLISMLSKYECLNNILKIAQDITKKGYLFLNKKEENIDYYFKDKI